MVRDIINLISFTVTKDSIGQEVPTITKREVFAEKKGIARNEFFTAGQIGIKPTHLFTLREFDYEGEEELEYDGVTYKVYRTFPKNELVELYCEVRSGKNG